MRTSSLDVREVPFRNHVTLRGYVAMWPLPDARTENFTLTLPCFFLLIRTAYVRPLIHVLDGLRKRCGRAVARVGITSKLRKYEG